MKKKLLLSIFILVLITIASYTVYVRHYKITDAYIIAHGWKLGEGDCQRDFDGNRYFFDVLNFEKSTSPTNPITLRNGIVYYNSVPRAEIVKRVSRLDSSSYIEVQNIQTKSICIYYSKWRN